MARKNKTYQRIKGRGGSMGSIQEAYLGPDHLLLVNRTTASERYNRIYYQDIQAVQSIPTSFFIPVMLVLSIITGFFILLWIFTSDTVSGVFMVFSIIMGLLSLLYGVGGRTTGVYIQTAVKRHEVRAFARRRKAARAMDMIRVRVEAEQGRLSPEALAPRVAQPPPGTPENPESPEGQAPQADQTNREPFE